VSLDPFEELAATRSKGRSRGLYSVCSSHPLVLEAAVRRSAANGLPLLVEATANQVNQEGGYTGLKPADFAARLGALRERYGVGEGQVLFGGDHLGPHPWRKLPAELAMARAEALVRAFVAAGARKIHLDASMALGGDEGAAPTPAVVAARAARLCAAAEDECRQAASGRAALAPPVYVIGTEVPVPGGVSAEGPEGPAPTLSEDFLATIAVHEELFSRAGLEAAWERVLAVVVQPGVEFDSSGLSPYRRERASGLTEALASTGGLWFEAHSTDYQSEAALCQLVEDGFAFLKVGPALSFALREALFGLSAIEAELRGASDMPVKAALRGAMLADDAYWRDYYPRGDGIALLYSLSDRARYYWDRPEPATAVEELFSALGDRAIPAGLLSQFLPRLGGPHAALGIRGASSPRELAMGAVDAELARYEAACFPSGRR
jgi:D-tagatose-bisphosphate aldolase class II non-catalytic subunit